MNDDNLRTTYRDHMPPRGASCPGPEAIQALVERAGSEPERMATLDHVMACRDCLQEFELLRSLAAKVPSSPARRWQAPAALAASVLLGLGAVLVWRSARPTGSEIERGGSLALSPISPRGDVAADGHPVTIVWRPATGVAKYGIEIRRDRTTIFHALTLDTAFVLPDSLTLTIGQNYSWQVFANPPDGPPVQSPVTGFRLRRP